MPGVFDFLRHAFRSGRGRYGIDELARRLDLTPMELCDVRPSYRQFTIPKHTGGTRRITAPDPDFKQFQRRLLRRVLGRLRVHPAAMGFQRGHSIATHALLHAMKPVVMRLDIRDFFASTASRRVERYFRAVGWDRSAADLLTQWCTHDGGLPQGAPTSPRLSNLVNFRLDARLTALAARWGCFYTRYADDLVLSLDGDRPHAINSVIHFVKEVVQDEGYRLHAKKKLRIMRRHDRQVVTGLVVNGGVNLPRRTRRWLRAVEHHRAAGRPATLTDAQLQGWHSLQHMIRNQTGGR